MYSIIGGKRIAAVVPALKALPAKQGVVGRLEKLEEEVPVGSYGRPTEARASFGKTLGARPAFMGGRTLERGTIHDRIATFMAAEMTALNASGTVRYNKDPREQLSLAGREPAYDVLPGYKVARAGVVASTRVWHDVDAATLGQPGTTTDPAILECGSVLSLLEHRFFAAEVAKRGGNFATYQRMLPRRRVDVTCNPETVVSPLVSFFETTQFEQGAVNALNVGHFVKRGDLLWIQGDPSYLQRFSGPNGGWHLACVGENAEGEPLFVGFSSKMTRPFTYAEMRELMLEEYPPDERARIVIGGVGVLRRFDAAEFESSLALAMVPEAATSSSDRVAPENAKATLASFEVRDASDARALEAAKAFLEEVRRHPEKSHVLHLQGAPGRGKTHLAQALLRELASDGRTTSFLAPRQVGDRYNILLGADRVEGEQAFWHDISARLDADVVALDDMNHGYGLQPDIVKQTLEAAGRSPKVVIITSNVLPGTDGRGGHKIDLPAWVAAEPARRTQTSVHQLTGRSRRTELAWTTAKALARRSDARKIKALAGAQLGEASPAAGIVVRAAASEVVDQLKAANPKLSVRCAGVTWKDDAPTMDSDFRSAESRAADVIVLDTDVHSCAYGAVRQLAALAERLFAEPNKRVVLRTSMPLEQLKAELKRYFELQMTTDPFVDHLINRVATIFPELAL